MGKPESYGDDTHLTLNLFDLTATKTSIFTKTGEFSTRVICQFEVGKKVGKFQIDLKMAITVDYR